MSLWDNLFSHLRIPVAQILLTRNDIADVCTLILYLPRHVPPLTLNTENPICQCAKYIWAIV